MWTQSLQACLAHSAFYCRGDMHARVCALTQFLHRLAGEQDREWPTIVDIYVQRVRKDASGSQGWLTDGWLTEVLGSGRFARSGLGRCVGLSGTRCVVVD